jgi:hypothetical protein
LSLVAEKWLPTAGSHRQQPVQARAVISEAETGPLSFEMAKVNYATAKDERLAMRIRKSPLTWGL